MNERYIIDRVEGKDAIIEKENGDMYKIQIEHIKGNYKAGDILINKGEYFEIDKNFTLDKRKRIKDSMKDMWEE